MNGQHIEREMKTIGDVEDIAKLGTCRYRVMAALTVVADTDDAITAEELTLYPAWNSGPYPCVYDVRNEAWL
jgi:hypothetical protein